VWRAANGIKSPRPATNRRNPTRNPPGPVETTPRPGHRVATNPPADAGADKPHAGPTPHRPRNDRQLPHKTAQQRPRGPSGPGR
jgi:hypothetical protein